MVLPFVPEDLLFPLDRPVTAGPLHTRDLKTGTPLEFRAFMEVDGIFSHLEGSTIDGTRWPREWSVPGDLSDTFELQLLLLPTVEHVRARESLQRLALASLLDVPPETLDSVDLVLHEPAAEADLATLSIREEALLPDQYSALLSISDGLSISDMELLGSRDAYRLDIPQTNRLVVAWVAGEEDDAVLVLDRSGTDEAVYSMDIHDPSLGSRRIAAGTRQLIVDALRTAKDTPPKPRRATGAPTHRDSGARDHS